MEEERREKDTNQSMKNLRDWVIALLIALCVALLLTQVIFVNAQIPSESMEDTIMAGDRVLGFRMAYWFKTPERGDIVIFRFPDDEKQLFVKRVIGMPGETLEIRNGQVFINGVEHPEVNTHVKANVTGKNGVWEIPEGSYFVMGDNRGNSWDSRYWSHTCVKEDQIIGQAVLRIFPNPGFLK